MATTIGDPTLYICPICGYNKLVEKPYDNKGNPSYEICNCCGYEYGFDDGSCSMNFDEYRKSWISKGAKWFNPKKKPPNWSLQAQLSNLAGEQRGNQKGQKPIN